MIRKIKTSLTAKLFLATTVLLILVCLLSVFSMARYIPQTYSNRLSAELQKQANDLVPVLEQADSLEECYSLVQQFAAQTKTSLDKGTQRKTTENELPSLTQCTA